MKIEKLAPNALQDTFEENCFVSNIEFEKISYFDLCAKFCLRDVKITEVEINAAMENSKRNGFINYLNVSMSHWHQHIISKVGKLINNSGIAAAFE